MYESLFPVLMAADVRQGACFYEDILSFSIDIAVDNQRQTVTSLAEDEAALAFAIMKYEEQVKLAWEDRHGFEHILQVQRGTPPGAG